VYAWCGPQPNSRLLLNYGIVDESNPYDKLQLTVTLPANDPLYKVKRGILQVCLTPALPCPAAAAPQLVCSALVGA
jgi:hypothetical protein